MSYQAKTIHLLTQKQKDLAKAAIDNAPFGIDVKLQEHKKARSLDQQSLLFAGPLKDISDQAWINGRQFSVEIWHRYCKEEFLPDIDEPYLFELVKDCDKYRKWDYNPRGERELVGSTTQLTSYGYSLYIEQVHAMGAGMGVIFHANPRDLQR